MDDLILRAPVEPEVVKETLRSIFLEERWKDFNPASKTRIEKPAKKMREILESLGADFESSPVLEQSSYKMSIITGYGNEFDFHYFEVDFHDLEVSVD